MLQALRYGDLSDDMKEVVDWVKEEYYSDISIDDPFFEEDVDAYAALVPFVVNKINAVPPVTTYTTASVPAHWADYMTAGLAWAAASRKANTYLGAISIAGGGVPIVDESALYNRWKELAAELKEIFYKQIDTMKIFSELPQPAMTIDAYGTVYGGATRRGYLMGSPSWFGR
jgi:hypothetical protein